VLYCAFDLSKIGCATFGNDTSNLAEGEMGNLIKYRKLYVQRACARERERENTQKFARRHLSYCMHLSLLLTTNLGNTELQSTSQLTDTDSSSFPLLLLHTFPTFTTRHPYMMIVQILEYIQTRMAANKAEADKHATTGKLLTPWASKALDDEMWLSRNNGAYKVMANGDCFVVWDTQRLHQQKHTCCIDPASPSCSPCNTWDQFRRPCRHMIIVIALHKPELLGKRKADFVKHYFHPAYHTANLSKAYANINLTLPDAPTGKPLADIDLSLDSEDDAAPVASSVATGTCGREEGREIKCSKIEIQTKT
jgi:hypothetical protein